MEQKLKGELQFCLELWEKQGYCEFGGHTAYPQCAVPYLLYKLMTGKVLHGKMRRLTLEDWKKRLNEVGKLK